MRIPEIDGVPTLRTQHLRTYGAGGFRLTSMEEMRGCPRQYRKRYVDHEVAAEKHAPALSYGTGIHAVLYRMEEHGIGPEQAMDEVWPSELPVEMWREARQDLEKYLERGGPMARYGTVDVEVEVTAPLYVDDDFGPVGFGGRIDWLGIDVEFPTVMHMVDFKSNRFPPSRDDLAGDVQLKGYDWLVRQNWNRWMPVGTEPIVVSHLDAIKWYDLEWRYDPEELEEWREWASAIARRILRDKKGEPQINAGCGWCPVKHDCPAYAKLPGDGLTLLEKRTANMSLEALHDWREQAQTVRKALEAGIVEVDEAIRDRVNMEGSFETSTRRWELDVAYANVPDLDALREVMGEDEFMRLAGISKTKALEWARRQSDPNLVDQVSGCFERLPSGTRVKSMKMSHE